MKRLLVILIFLTVPFRLIPQSGVSEKDSLMNALEISGSNDFESRFRILDRLYEIYLVNDLPSALTVAKNAHSLAIRCGNDSARFMSETRMGYVLYSQGKNDSSLIMFNHARESLKVFPDKEKEAEILNNIANIFRVTARYDTSMVIYTGLLKYYESIHDLTRQGKVLSNIGSLYYTAGNQEKAREYTLKALEIQSKSDDKRSIAVSLVNLSVFALNKGDYKEGIKYGDEAVRLLADIDKNYYAAALLRVGYCHFMTGDREKALDFTRTAIDIFKINRNARGMMEAYRQQGEYLNEMGRYADAFRLGKEALLVADTTNRLDMRLLYDMLKISAIRLNVADEAIYYSQQQIRMKEEDLNQEWAGKIADADARYNTEKKELQIAALTAEKKNRTKLLLLLLTILLAGGLTSWFIYRNQKQRQQLAAQRIKELEQEKQITATQSLLEGETTERARLSRDLHDGLGGMLSSAKLKIATMKGNLTIPEENVASLNSAIELLDTSIRELRRVAHNLMPESLMKYGLNAALADFCRSTGKAGYHFFGNERRPDEKTEIAVYRIVNELVNNSLRHSEAENINVQLILDDSRVHVIVEDDGKGFDAASAAATGGTGLRNITSRVTSLGGKLDIISAPGKGTEVNVEFNA